DTAGNYTLSTRILTRQQLIAPVIAASALAGPLPWQPSVTGVVRAEATVTQFAVGIDHQRTAEYVNVLPDLVAGAFTFSIDKLTKINGGPLSSGTHTLYLTATDSQPLSSTLTSVTFTVDYAASGSVNPVVTLNPTTGLYDYTFAAV